MTSQDPSDPREYPPSCPQAALSSHREIPDNPPIDDRQETPNPRAQGARNSEDAWKGSIKHAKEAPQTGKNKPSGCWSSSICVSQHVNREREAPTHTNVRNNSGNWRFCMEPKPSCRHDRLSRSETALAMRAGTEMDRSLSKNEI